LRIAYLTGEYPRVTDTFIQREVAALRQQGEVNETTVQTFSVRLPQSYESLSTAQKEESDRTRYLLPVQPLELLTAHSLLLFTRPRRYLKTLRLAWKTRQLGVRGTIYQLIYFLEAGILTRWLHHLGIEHLHNHFGDSSGTVTMLASALGDFGYSMTLHGPAIFFEPYRWQLSEKISRAKFVSCISYFCRSQAMIFAPLSAWPNLHIVHCGIDPKAFAERAFADVETLTSAQRTGHRLLFVGRLAAAKGLPILLQSMAELKLTCDDIQLTVVGDGEDRAVLEAQVSALNLTESVDFVGYQSPDAVQGYLRQSDIFVMSSFAEGVPVVLMEAMMAGLPVVATQIAGISELVEEGVNGFIVPPGDIPSLTARIQRLMADGDLRRQLGDRGRVKVSESFNIHHEAKKLHQLMLSSYGLSPGISRQASTPPNTPSSPPKSKVGAF